MNSTAIISIEAFPLDVPLLAPFTVSSTQLDRVQNVAIRVRLASNTEGWGEIPALQPITFENQETAFEAIDYLRPKLLGQDAAAWRRCADDLAGWLVNLNATRAGVEIAILDALTREWGVPLYQFFGGASSELTTDITIPICPAQEAHHLANEYRNAGFMTIKTKVGLDIAEDISRLLAIRRAHPDCALILDANEGFTANEAVRFLEALRNDGIVPAAIEQPVPCDDWDGLKQVTIEGGVPVVADESCRSVENMLRIVRDKLASAVNIKIAKCGVSTALDIVAIAKGAGLQLMIGGMVETRLLMGFSAHFAAGIGGFKWIDLDTPLLLADDPINGGYIANGPRYSLSNMIAGHGGSIAIAQEAS